MKTLNKLFFEIEMTWKRVILFAIITGVFTGVVMLIHALDNTSLHNIGVTYEAWILFAVIICSNCKKPVEAGLKTFVFFLISQPLVYLTMWSEYQGFPWHYYRFWFILTILTLPGGFIAWLIKRKDILGTLVLSCANVFLGMCATADLINIIRVGGFPWGLLTVIFCYAQIVVYIALYVPDKKNRILAIILAVGVSIGFNLPAALGHVKSSSGMPAEGFTETTVIELDDERIATVIPGEDYLDVTAHKIGETVMHCTFDDGTTKDYTIIVDNHGLITVK